MKSKLILVYMVDKGLERWINQHPDATLDEIQAQVRKVIAKHKELQESMRIPSKNDDIYRITI